MDKEKLELYTLARLADHAVTPYGALDLPRLHIAKQQRLLDHFKGHRD